MFWVLWTTAGISTDKCLIVPKVNNIWGQLDHNLGNLLGCFKHVCYSTMLIDT
jgi:hypothetical protein